MPVKQNLNATDDELGTASLPLSIVILAKNEESNIARCVDALRWCNDVIVVDDQSTDKTAEVAAGCGARVVQHKFESFAKQRNWTMRDGIARNAWVLHLDADEVVTPGFRDELIKKVLNAHNHVVAFTLCRKTMMDNRWLRFSDGFPVWIMRIVRNGSVEFQDSGHGEVAVPGVSGAIEKIREPILHYPFSKGLEDWINRHNRYSTREALLESSRQDTSVPSMFSIDRAKRRLAIRTIARRTRFRGILRFFYQYVLTLGFLDGRPGLKFCALMSTYEWWISEKRREFEKSLSPNSCEKFPQTLE